ncbi:hypothetical protein [Nodosilinea sp. LEGE 07088]|uniref:hypothetical protein n=1 Tax=Nodosilinea sp. LEGE 07088 TaxID=2777968 RepID=UPI001D13430F|nr:hypothetical protein [Nodosilinea sp. LEGE 07088]
MDTIMAIGLFEVHVVLTPTAFIGSEMRAADNDLIVSVEIRQKLSNYPRPDREPVKLLAIGSREAIQAMLQQMHLCGFAEIFEWTDFLPAPTPERPLQCQPGELMRMLVKYFSKPHAM